MRLRDRVRFVLWRAIGTHGHLPQCRPTRVVAMSRCGDGLVSGWRCADNCPAAARTASRRERAS